MRQPASDSTSTEPVANQLKTVPAPYRTTEQITEMLAHIAAVPGATGELARLRTLDILDHLAEQMIGRRGPEDAEIKATIQSHCDRLRPPVAHHDRPDQS